MRVLRFLFATLAMCSAALAIPSSAAAACTLDRPVPVSAVRAAIPISHVPAPTHRHVLDMVALGAVMGATAKKKPTRRAAAKKTDVPMYLDGIAHVQRKNEDTDKMETVAITGGVLVDDTDLSDEEIDELTAMRIIRPATSDEIARLEQAEANAERAEKQQAHEAEVTQLRANQEAERAAAVARNATPDQLAKLDERHAVAKSALEEKQAKALAAE